MKIPGQFCVLFVSGCLGAGCGHSGHRSAGSAAGFEVMDVLDGGSWKIYHAEDLTDSLANAIKLVDTQPMKGAAKLGRTESAGSVAYIVDAPKGDNAQMQYLFIETQDAVIRLEGLPLGHRPLGSPRWLSNHLIQIDRWSNPHFGIRYVIDVQNRRLVSANSFADQHYIDTKRTANVQP